MSTPQTQQKAQIAVVFPFDPLCAWCLQAAGIEPQSEDSHGICVAHREIVELAYHVRRFERTKSFVGRFADGRGNWQ